MFTLVFICNGTTDWNLDKRCTGHTDVPLNERGRCEAEKIGKTLRSTPFSAVYTSDLRRAQETAEIITLLHDDPVEIHEDRQLREFNFGGWEGKQFAEINRCCGNDLDTGGDDFVPLFPPRGETLESFRLRLLKALDGIAQVQHDSDVVAVVTHGLVIALARTHCARESVNSFWDYVPGNSEVIKLGANRETFRQ
jgi:probable phosphoglycerate mutase